MKRKLTSILLMSALLVGGASTFVSCKDYDGDQAAVTNANVKGLSDKLQEQITALETLKSDINTKLNGKADQSVVDALNTKVDNAIADLQRQIDNIATCSCPSLDDLKLIFAEQAYVQSIKDNLDVLLAKDLVTEDDISSLRSDMSALKTLFGENLEDAVTKANLADYVKKGDEFSTELLNTLNTLLANSGLQNISNVVELFAEIDKIAGMNDSIAALSSKCALLAGQYSLLNDKIDSLVTGVRVDMVKNPIFGTLNTPFGLKSYVLAGFVGDEVKNTPFYEENGQWQIINSGEKVAASANGGNVYLTINPSNINAEGWNIGRLVGRDGSFAPGYGSLVLAADNTPVTTRATNNLGGYVATANFDNPLEAKINVNKDELASVAKNVLGALRREESLDITNAVGTIYKTFANAIDQYYGVNVKYGKDGAQSYISPFDIAAVTIKPLSFNTLEGKGFTIKSIPQLQDVLGIDLADYQFTWENLKHLDPMKKYITVTIPNTEGATINGIPAPSVDIDKSKLVVIKTEDYLKDDNGEFILDNNGNKIKTIVDVEVNILEGLVTVGEIDLSHATIVLGPDKEEEFEVVIEMDEFNNMIDEINNNVGGMLSNVNDLLDKAQSGIDKINNSVIARLNQVIAKVNKITENPNALLQPVMLYSDANGAGRLSESSIAPTRFNLNGQSEGAITLVATSYTGEMLAPAWKKHVSVEGAGGSVNVSGVIDGAQNKIIFTAKPGKYTINYDAIDFYGQVRNKKYYVEVK
ncbi:MAG: hypothetical protein ACI3ZD_00765 [Prevotella sp.]